MKYNSRLVKIGNIELGGDYSVRLQTMTNTDTMNTIDSVNQIIRCVKAGAELIRLTTQGIKEAENLKIIKQELLKKDIDIPIIADIHFNPKVAEVAATIADKIRVNPGNYTDKKNFSSIEFTDQSYQAEINKIKDRFVPLLEICKKHNTVIRIGANHGSLSDRIISKYGDTPLGMVESVMEFLRICKEENFNSIVLSMKSSNTRIMIYSTRLLVKKMMEENMNFPIHLGVTEAGEGEDGRIKSAVGIGTMLAEGIGDTIRVSLTEAPEKEIPIAKQIVDYFSKPTTIKQLNINPFDYKKRESTKINKIGGNQLAVVIADLSEKKSIDNDLIKLSSEINFYYLGDQEIVYLLGKDAVILNYNKWLRYAQTPETVFPYFTTEEFIKISIKSDVLNFVEVQHPNDIEKVIAINEKIALVLFAQSRNNHIDLLNKLIEINCKLPIIFKRFYTENSLENFQIKAAGDIGAFFIDGMGDGIWLNDKGSIPISSIVYSSLNILQACRIRLSKTEFISCPSCGRTLFNIEESVKQIKIKIGHLKGLKIAVMGCIVNGPGEMADADYGYVGAGAGKISLYKGKDAIKKNIDEKNALNELISLIKENGQWIDPN